MGVVWELLLIDESPPSINGSAQEPYNTHSCKLDNSDNLTSKGRLSIQNGLRGNIISLADPLRRRSHAAYEGRQGPVVLDFMLSLAVEPMPSESQFV